MSIIYALFDWLQCYILIFLSKNIKFIVFILESYYVRYIKFQFLVLMRMRFKDLLFISLLQMYSN